MTSLSHQVVTVTEFKAKCLALLDSIAEHGGTITITKRGKALAKVAPAGETSWKSPEGSWAGRVIIPEDLLAADLSDNWSVLRETARRAKGTRR